MVFYIYTPPLDPSCIVQSMAEGSKGGVYIGDEMLLIQ